LKARDGASDKNKLRAEQTDWIRMKRNACPDKPCIAEAYRERISQLR
jgi:uncharacterized protein